MAEDTVPDVEPDEETTTPPEDKPVVSNANDFFSTFIIIFAFIILHRIGWQVMLLMIGTMPSSAISVLFWLWMIPIMGVLSSIIWPALGKTTMWILVSSCISGGLVIIAWHYVLLFGNRISQ